MQTATNDRRKERDVHKYEDPSLCRQANQSAHKRTSIGLVVSVVLSSIRLAVRVVLSSTAGTAANDEEYWARQTTVIVMQYLLWA